MIFFDVLKCDSTYNWEKKLLIIVNVLKFLHMSTRNKTLTFLKAIFPVNPFNSQFSRYTILKTSAP